MIYDPNTKFVNLVYVLSTWGIENPKEMIEEYIAINLSHFNESDEESEIDIQEWNGDFRFKKIYPAKGGEPEYYFRIEDTLYVVQEFLDGTSLCTDFNEAYPSSCFIDTERLGVALMNGELFCLRLWEIWVQLESNTFKELMDMVEEREMILKKNKKKWKRSAKESSQKSKLKKRIL